MLYLTIAFIAAIGFVCWAIIRGGQPSCECPSEEAENIQEDEDTVLVVNPFGQLEVHHYNPMGYDSLGI